MHERRYSSGVPCQRCKSGQTDRQATVFPRNWVWSATVDTGV